MRFQSPYSIANAEESMVIIKCINPNCTAPHRKFEWDETPHGGLADPHAEGAARVIAVCPSCGTENAVWVKRAKKSDALTRGSQKP